MSTSVPELKLYQIVSALISEIEADYLRHADKKDTFLFHLFGEHTSLGKYNYMAQAVSLFTDRAPDNPRKPKVRMMFDAKQSSMPTIHITMPSESGDHNTIGVGEGGRRDEDFVTSDTDGTVAPLYRRNFQTTFHIVCTSDSSQEVFLMYHVLRAAMITALDYINLAGMQNPKLSGQDIRQQDHLVSPHIYMRGIGLACFYSVEVPRYFDTKLISDIVLTGTPIDPNTTTE